VAALKMEVPEGDAESLVEAPESPVNLKLYRCTRFPDSSTTFRAYSSYYGGKPWFDYGFTRVDHDQEGGESDPIEPDSKRTLVKFWGFTEHNGVVYACVDYCTRHSPRPGHRGEWRPHPTMRTYKFNTFYHRGAGEPNPPFFAVPVSSTIASAVIFPGPDNRKCVLYFPTDTYMGAGDPATVPDPADYVPAFPDPRPPLLTDSESSDISFTEPSSSESEVGVPPMELSDNESDLSVATNDSM